MDNTYVSVDNCMMYEEFDDVPFGLSECINLSENTPITTETAVALESIGETYPLTSLEDKSCEFYLDPSNLWMIDMYISRIGNPEVDIGFRIEAIELFWSLTRNELLHSLLLEHGGLEGILKVLNEFCYQKPSEFLPDLTVYKWCHEEQMRAFALLSLNNLIKLSNFEKIQGDTLEKIVNLAGRYISSLPKNLSLEIYYSLKNDFASKNINPYNMAVKSRQLILKLNNFSDSSEEELTKKFNELLHIEIKKPKIVEAQEYIKEVRINVC